MTNFKPLPPAWRDRLPPPDVYYRVHVKRLGQPNESGNASGLCPFHPDTNASLSVQLIGSRGMFRCFGCGARGDMIDFETRRTGLSFAEAVRSLMRMPS